MLFNRTHPRTHVWALMAQLFINILQYVGPFGPLSGIKLKTCVSCSGINKVYRYKYVFLDDSTKGPKHVGTSSFIGSF